MAHLPAGTRVVLHGEQGSTLLRTLEAVDLGGAFEVAVMGDAGSQVRTGRVEITVPQGVLTVPARLDDDGPGLVLRSTGELPSQPEQRRDNVRAALTLPVRAAVLDDARPDALGGPGARVQDLVEVPGAVLTGVTTSVSGGGVALLLQAAPAGIGPQDRLYLEIELAPDQLVAALCRVVQIRRDALRLSFLDITAADVERLVRAVFAEQRRALAARRLPGGSGLSTR